MRLAVEQRDPYVDEGMPGRQPREACARTPFSTDGMNCRGTEPPTTLSTNSMPLPVGSGSTSISQIANCPCPPDCLTWRPRPAARPAKVSRRATRCGSASTWTPYRLRSRSRATS